MSEGIIEVTRTDPFGEQDVKTESIKVKPFKTDVAKVKFSAGATINVGNYQSERIDIGISMPCYIEEINDVFNDIKEFVHSKLEEEKEYVQEKY